MAKRNRATMVKNTSQRKIKIEQHEPNKAYNVFLKDEQFLLH